MDEQSQEEMLAAQKANCPFCKIVTGEIPSKKVYEDELMLAILDINPANKGHVLVMPKEHHYILPLVPPETFQHMFLQSKKLMTAMRKGLIVTRVTLFVANGAIAGQQSPHFLFHLIPREENDGLDQLDLTTRGVQQENEAAIAQNTKAIMRNLPVQAPPAPPNPSGQQQPREAHTIPQSSTHQSSTPQTPQERLAALFDLLKKEPELHQLLLQDPAAIEEHIKKNPVLQQAFAGINLQELSAQLATQAKKPASQQSLNVPRAIDLSDEELTAFLEQKPELKRLLAEDLQGLHAMIPQNAKLQQFFTNTTPEAVAARVDEPGGEIDFDLLAQHLK